VTKRTQEIVIIGAGKLASHLGLAFVKQGIIVRQVYNRTRAPGLKLAKRIGSTFTADIREINPEASVYIMAVSDSGLEQLAGRLKLRNKLVIHTSGAIGMDILQQVSKNIGVFYPVQTFSQKTSVDFRKIPVCLEANSVVAERQLTGLAEKITGKIYYLDSDKRRLLHLGAVFSANFTNFMFTVAEELMVESGIDFDLLKPLIGQTARNTDHGNLFKYQTGPAFREDSKVIAIHRGLLASHPDYLEIYNLISENIIRHKLLYGKL
jgi:predicted short-subunit dehydrogenase-like oxidoreductase (DUF2520 family)